MHKFTILHHKAKEASSYVAMQAVPGPCHPIGALYRCHSLNHNITGSIKHPSEKHTSLHWPVEMLVQEAGAIKWISV